MRAEWIVGLVVTSAIGSTVIGSTKDEPFDPLGPLVGGGSIEERAERIALRDFAAKAELQVLEVWTQDTRIGDYGDIIEARPDHTFFFCRVRLENTGRLDLIASTWHFSALDEVGSDHAARLANLHDDFDGSRLRKGGAREGVVIFEMYRTSQLTAVVWQGEIANATGAYHGVPEHRVRA